MHTEYSIEECLQRTTLTKWQLTQALMGDGSIAINGFQCWLSSTQREDGSGNSFNLIVSHGDKKYNVYARANA